MFYFTISPFIGVLKGIFHMQACIMNAAVSTRLPLYNKAYSITPVPQIT